MLEHRTLFVISLCVHLLGAAILPITQDEAYYFFWAQYPDWGYFDHPPLIAWLMMPGTWCQSIFVARLLPITMAMATYWYFLQFLEYLGVHRPQDKTRAVVLYAFNLFFGVFGVIATPDVPMLFFWMLALLEAAKASEKNPKRWLLCGLYVGLGTLGKYTMVLIGPVFAFFVLNHPKMRRQIWPYLGAIIAVLVFLPNILWNASQDWISYRFQFNRGLLSNHHIQGDFATSLPLLNDEILDISGFILSQNLWQPTPLKPMKPALSPQEKTIKRQVDYWGGQLAAWGLFAIPIVMGCLTRRRQRGVSPRNPRTNTLAKAATWFPLVFFGIVAFKQPIEANWPAAYLIGASALMSSWVPLSRRWQILLLSGNMAIVMGLFLLGRFPLKSLETKANRLWHEVHGFRELADTLKGDDTPLFADTYQLTSMLNYYIPESKVRQWPGLTRPSELTRRRSIASVSFDTLMHKGRFKLVTTRPAPPSIAGFQVSSLTLVKDCMGQLQIIHAPKVPSEPTLTPLCTKSPHEWFVAEYLKH